MTKLKTYQEAKRRIDRAFRFQQPALDLSDLGLTELPPSISLCEQLREVNLSNNKLLRLPAALGKLRQLESLLIYNNQLKVLPSWLGQLKQLRVLDVFGNDLTNLPSTLDQLNRLQSLDLFGNRVKTLPAQFLELNELRSLDIAENALQHLPDGIGRLKSLKHLDVSHNLLKAIPESLGDLKELQSLDIYGNELRRLPDSLGQLRHLSELDASNNELQTLPETLGQLTQLRELDVSHNQLRTLPEALGFLTKLRSLLLFNNELTVLPESLLQLKLLEKLFLHGNPRLTLSAEILGPTWEETVSGSKQHAHPRAILALYFSQRRRSAKPLNEVKLLLVGHGRVGKTSLSKALRGIPHNKREAETPGIERHPLPLTAAKSTITAHVWDFGGQEFLHQTHQFFFSERSIYVVVLTGRQGHPMQEAEYWLRLIRTYGTGSPVVIALNQIRAHPFTVDKHFLQENYPEVRAVVRTDCDPRWGIEGLRKLLGQLAGGMPSVREKIDPAWARVRTRLEEMKESFVTFERYREICAELGVTTDDQQETLAKILDCLGIALNYRDDPRLRDTSVLKPRWLVDGIYMVLRWLHRNETYGELRIRDFSKALKNKKNYPPQMHPFLLALMEKFELCFPIEAKHGTYLVPGLLDANQPRELSPFMKGNSRRIQFRYEDVRPPGLLPRFIVRSHTLSERQPRWLRGVVLKRGKGRALVRGDHEGRVTDVFVLGESANDRVWLSEFIVSEMRILNENLPVRTFVESEAQPGAWTELEVLREAALSDEVTRTEKLSDGATVLIPVTATLREVESPEATAPHASPLSLFICYARANERTVKHLVPSLKVLARRGYIAPWRDTDLVPGDDWDENIQARLAKSRIILFMVSRDFLCI